MSLDVAMVVEDLRKQVADLGALRRVLDNSRSDPDPRDDDIAVLGLGTVRVILAALERAERIEAAAREMLLLGDHDGLCTNHDAVSGPEGCLLHVEASGRRRSALAAALGPAQ